MDDEDALYDAFTSRHLWKSSTFFDDPSGYDSSLFAPLQLDVPLIKLDHPYAPKGSLETALQLPDIDTFEFGPLPELESLDESSLSIDTLPPETEDDIWQIAFELGPANKDIEFFTWEAFDDREYKEPPTPYITESGPQPFDAALARDDATLAAGRIVKANVLLESLYNLGLGRSSILFSFNSKLRTFEPTVRNGRASGTSLGTTQSLMNQFIFTGNTFLYLRSFVERTVSSASSIPAMVALATCVSSILSTFEDHLGRHSREATSLLQLQRLFARPRDILTHVARLVDVVKFAKTNEQLSSILHHRLLEIEEGDAYVRQLSAEILRRVAKPTLELLGEWIGTQQVQQTIPIEDRGSFVAVDDTSDTQGSPEYHYSSEMMPRFITLEDGNTIFETGNSLRFLKTHHPEHPLSCLGKFGVKPPELDWQFGWQDIEVIASKAKRYEEELRAAILHFTANSDHPSESYLQVVDCSIPGPHMDSVTPASNFKQYIEESAQLFDQEPRPAFNDIPDELQIVTAQLLSKNSAEDVSTVNNFSPPISMTSALSLRPLLAAQAKLVNATTLRLFFRSHGLRMHLFLQRQYHLLGDGVFSSRLASALFDPDRESAERHKGQMRSGVHMGLQLGSRSSWPPASSELRLALMGVLSESYYSSSLYYSTQRSKGKSADDPQYRREKDELPGQLNFAIRQLTEPEMEKVMDPDSLYALDFLRLQYVPPSPLNHVFTSATLEKYDHIFKFLLRLLRMLFVVAHLPRDYSETESYHFRMEAHHFVMALSSYVFQTGIADHWSTFDSLLTTTEALLAAEDAVAELGTRVTKGLASLRDGHEMCLDSIMFSLLLRKRQKKVMALLEEIFGLILRFAKLQNGREDTEAEATAHGDGKELYAMLKGKIRVFVSVCRGLTGKKGYGKGKGTAEENTLERLSVLLEMNGYFSG
ncbi:Spc98 family-domain-containing protein [Massariosphaeria phaeospora]|uniref:Spindle pole body component n=1 Tax=Massariosphaeria phaeospora TaxID=100035 RepID=A0A7C8I9C8_9PLEO|nr:Spc98 family-domain-containing protein [Massariosphaeria phaeospora]